MILPDERPDETDRGEATRLLLAQCDRQLAGQMLKALGLDLAREASGSPAIGSGDVRTFARDSESRRRDLRCDVIDSLITLHRLDLAEYDLLICACSLIDGSGLDALEYVLGVRPQLPVILTGSPDQTVLAAEAIRAGAMDFLSTRPADLRTLPLVVEKGLAHQRLRKENARLQGQLSRSLAELALTNRRLQQLVGQFEVLARTDELTGLNNRRWLNLMLEHHWAQSTRRNLPLAMVMLDLDGFKRINDELGHQRGDELLRLTAQLLRANCRAADVLVRYGGDEFCIIMPQTTPREAVLVARRLLREFRAAMERQPERDLGLGISIGLAHLNLSNPENVQQLLRHADEALYKAKSAGRNRIRVRRAKAA